MTGQFLSIDPEVSTTNQPYVYTGDNPVNASDPTGQGTRYFIPITWQAALTYGENIQLGGSYAKALLELFGVPASELAEISTRAVGVKYSYCGIFANSTQKNPRQSRVYYCQFSYKLLANPHICHGILCKAAELRDATLR